MIVIPMVGKSSRFFKAGYEVPKYMLPLAERTLFYHAVSSFRRYFLTDRFVFVVRDEDGVQEFVEEQISLLGIVDYYVCAISGDTKGQAHTVFKGLERESLDQELYIFNIDSIRFDFVKMAGVDHVSGYLEVFEGDGDHWSFVLPCEKVENKVLKTTEKDRVSNLCSNGLYYFSTKGLFDWVFKNAWENKDLVRGEYYIAPLYNQLIDGGRHVAYRVVPASATLFCGTPVEYTMALESEALLKESLGEQSV